MALVNFDYIMDNHENEVKPAPNVSIQNHNISNYIYFNPWNLSSSGSSKRSHGNAGDKGHSNDFKINHHNTTVIEGNNNAGDLITADTLHISDIFPAGFYSNDSNSKPIESYKDGVTINKDIALGVVSIIHYYTCNN